MKAVIMAGGEGTRLRPLTCDRPKPLVPVLGVPVMRHGIELLKKHGITEIYVTLQYLPAEIIRAFGDGSSMGVRLSYFTEDAPLGTAGSVKNAVGGLNEDFLVISGDALTDIDLTEVIRFHKEKKAEVTLVLSEVERPLAYGIVITAPDGRVERFLEKPDWNEVYSNTANTGIYVLSSSVLQDIPSGEFCDFAKDVFPKILEQRRALYGYTASGYWCDIGDIESYLRCHRDALDGKVELPLMCAAKAEGVYMEEGVSVGENALLEPPVYLCKGCRIENGAYVGPYSVIGKNSALLGGSSVKHGVLMEDVHLSGKAAVRGALLGDRVSAASGVQIYENAVIGSLSKLGRGSKVEAGVKIWPNKNIEENSVVRNNLVWGAGVSSKLFSSGGVRGELNVDITPEKAVRLGAALGAMAGGKVGISYDSQPACEMLMTAVCTGLSSAGIQVYCFGEQVLPITRSAVCFYGLDAGVHLNMRQEDGADYPEFSFMNASGANFTRSEEKKLEGLFMREEFVRCGPERIKAVIPVENYKEYYLRSMLNSLQSSEIRRNLEIRTKSETVSGLLKSLLSELEKRVYTPQKEREFRAEIAENGETLTLYTMQGERVGSEQLLALFAVMLLKKQPESTVVLPLSASTELERLIKNNGGKVVYSKTSAPDFMEQILAHGTREQFLLCFDALYAVLAILDFLNLYDVDFDIMVNKLPVFYKNEVEVECPDEKKGVVIQKLLQLHQKDKTDLTEGIKIYQNDGWALIVPENNKQICRVIIEGHSMEAASELTDIFTNEVKKLAKK